MNRPVKDVDEVYARTFQEVYHRLEIVVNGRTPFEALKSLAQQGVVVPNFQTQTNRFLQVYQNQLTLVDIDLGFNALVEEGTTKFDAGSGMLMDDPTRAKNLMGRLGSLGMHVIGLPQQQSITVTCGSSGQPNAPRPPTNSSPSSTSTLGYLKLRSCGLPAIVSDTAWYNYYEPSVPCTQTPLIVPNMFNSPIQIRFSYPLRRFDITNPPGLLTDPALPIQPAWKASSSEAGVELMYLDDWRMNYEAYQGTDGAAPALSELVDDTDLDMLDVSVAAAIDCLKLPIRILFQVKPVVRAVQAWEPNYK